MVATPQNIFMSSGNVKNNFLKKNNLGENCFSYILDAGWFEIDDLVYLYNAEGVQPSTKIASFDMDHTLITTKTGDVWPEHKGLLSC